MASRIAHESCNCEWIETFLTDYNNTWYFFWVAIIKAGKGYGNGAQYDRKYIF